MPTPSEHSPRARAHGCQRSRPPQRQAPLSARRSFGAIHRGVLCMSLRLTYRKTRAKGRRKTGSGSYYIEGTDHTGQRVHLSLHTGDRDLAKREFAKHVAKSLEARAHGPKAVMNFADAYEVYREAKG